MSWAEPDPGLKTYVEDQQLRALRTYEVNPDLIDEHVGQEDSFRTGGYGERQINELLQNAVDALTMSKLPGSIEFRVADGNLYVANAGATFTEAGVRAICYAFLSPKRDEESIGRFGLGFKSGLGITNQPQVFSRSVSFGFNMPGTKELFASNPAATGRLPLLRVPMLIDMAVAMREDRHLSDLASWASTIVKLPLTRDGKRIRDELAAFDTRALLFMKSVDKLTTNLQKADDSLDPQIHRREGDASGETFVLHSPGGESTPWLFAERIYEPSAEARSSLPETISRKRMTLSYAVPASGQFGLGELWAWFPLQERTTARGIFNAPWQVNDDRTRLIPRTALNSEMLAQCAELFLDVSVRASTPQDPAAHLDLFPARGKEGRGWGDETLSDLIPTLARDRALIPDRDGVLRTPDVFKGVPDLTSDTIALELVEAWLTIVDRPDFPHPTAFSSARDRYTRLRALLRRSDDKPVQQREVPLRRWLEELASARTTTAVASVLQMYTTLQAKRDRADIAFANVIPLADGKWASPNAISTVLIPRPGAPVPDGVSLIDEDLAAEPSIRTALKVIGFREVSDEEVIAALAATASDSWTDLDWERLWKALGASAPSPAAAALQRIRANGLTVKVRTVDEQWRPAREIFAGASLPTTPQYRLPHATTHGGRSDLLVAAGSLQTAPDPNYPLHTEPLYDIYRNAVLAKAKEAARAQGVTARPSGLIEAFGAGPLQLLVELQDDTARADWTRKILSSMQARMIDLAMSTNVGRSGTLPVASPEWWAVLKHGLIPTSRGLQSARNTVGSALSAYAAVLPVADVDLSFQLDAPRTLAEIADSLLLESLASAAGPTSLAKPLAELLVEYAGRVTTTAPERIPAVREGRISASLLTEVVLASSDEEVILIETHGLPYVDGRDLLNSEVLIERWNLVRAVDALSRSIEIQNQQTESLVLDLYPSLRNRTSQPLGRVRVARCAGIINKSASPVGQIETRLRGHRIDDMIFLDDSLDSEDALLQISEQLSLGLTREEARQTLKEDEQLQRNELLEQVRGAVTDADRALMLAGARALKDGLPRGLLAAIEAKRGAQTDAEIAHLYMETKGTGAVRDLSDAMRQKGLPVPERWAPGSEPVRKHVLSLGFPVAFAGTEEARKPQVMQVQGRIELNPLHDFQEDLAADVRTLVLEPGEDGSPRRGLLFLPTGAGKTRVTVESIVRMLLAGELKGPILWIAQSGELCEQAVQTWMDVWRALGDDRVIDLCRFWGNYELDESEEELQIVVATDDKLLSRLRMSGRQYAWLANPTLVVVDEAHTAGTPTYTEILRWLGLTATKTERPLLGLTATPYRGRNEELTRRLVDRFGERRLDALDPDDPIGQLRLAKVLAEVDHEVLKGTDFVPTGTDLADFTRMKEVSKMMLDRIGQDLERTQTIVDDILRRPSDWPILVFAASVASAHTISALLRLSDVKSAAVDGSMRGPERRNAIERFRSGEIQVLVNCELLTQGFDAPQVRALYVARPTFSPNRYHQMVGRGLRGPANLGTERCLIVNVADTFDEFGAELAFTDFDYLWSKR